MFRLPAVGSHTIGRLVSEQLKREQAAPEAEDERGPVSSSRAETTRGIGPTEKPENILENGQPPKDSSIDINYLLEAIFGIESREGYTNYLINNKDELFSSLGIAPRLRGVAYNFLYLLASRPEISLQDLKQDMDRIISGTISSVSPQAENSTEEKSAASQARKPPMPTTEELERDTKLYSQAFKAAEEAGRRYTIIDHLRAVWMPWIETGELTRPILRQAKGSAYGDRAAYEALTRWLANHENDLKKALGYNISSKSDLVTRRVAESAKLPPGERPARDDRALRYRLQKEQKHDRGGRG